MSYYYYYYIVFALVTAFLLFTIWLFLPKARYIRHGPLKYKCKIHPLKKGIYFVQVYERNRVIGHGTAFNDSWKMAAEEILLDSLHKRESQSKDRK